MYLLRHTSLWIRPIGISLAELALVWAQSDSLNAITFLKRECRRLCRFQGRGHGQPGAEEVLRYLTRRWQKMGYSVRVDTFWIRIYRFERVRAQGDRRKWREGRDYLPAADCPTLHGEWLVDTLPAQGKAWWVPPSLPVKEALKIAREKDVAVVLFPQRKLTASLAEAPGTLPLLYVRDTLPRPKTFRAAIRGHSRMAPAWNISAHLKGQRSDSAWVVGAHYDHLGRLGRATFWGANDNSSGVALLLLLAERLRKRSMPYDIWFVAFGAEESGLIGSQVWVAQPPYPLNRLRGMINLDLVGFGEKGVAVVGGSDQPDFWHRADRIRVQQGWDPPILVRPNAPNSDHYPFREKGVPALFFYLQGGPGFYHDIYDRPQTLTWAGTYRLLRWIEAWLSSP